MRQRLLIFISITLFFSVNINAEEDISLPALPTDSVILESPNISGKDDISFWQKILSFFGFEGKKEPEEDNAKKEIKQKSGESRDNIGNIDKYETQEIEKHNLSLSTSGSVPKINNFDKIEDKQSGIKHTNDINIRQDDKVLSILEDFKDDSSVNLSPPKLSESLEEKQNSAQIKNLQNVEDNSQIEIPKELDSVKDKPIKENIDINQGNAEEDRLKLPKGFESINPNNNISELPKVIENVQQEPQKPNEKDETLVKAEEDISISPLPGSESIPSETIPIGQDNNKIDSIEKQKVEKLPLPNNKSLKDKEVIPKASEINEDLDNELPTPEYADLAQEKKAPETDIDKFTRVFESTESRQKNLPQITEQDFKENDEGKLIKQESVGPDPIQIQFINNEAQVLILPNDDVVLGELTEQAKLNQMDLYDYIKKFWDNYDKIKREPQRKAIERFIEEYDENFKQ